MKRNMAAELREPIKTELVQKKYRRLSLIDWNKGYSAVPGHLGNAEKAKVTERAKAIREQTELLDEDAPAPASAAIHPALAAVLDEANTLRATDVDIRSQAPSHLLVEGRMRTSKKPVDPEAHEALGALLDAGEQYIEHGGARFRIGPARHGSATKILILWRVPMASGSMGSLKAG